MRELVKSKFNIFPEMISEEYMRLKSDIEVNGFDKTMPVTLYKGDILDGWNRYKATKELNIDAEYIDFKGDDSEAIEFVMRSNKRRNLTSSQWACIAVEAEEFIDAISKKVEEDRISKQKENALNQYTTEKLAEVPLLKKLSQPKSESETNKKIADLFNTNRTYINEAKKIKQNSKEVLDKVKSGELNLKDAKSLTKLDKPKQIQILSQIKEGKAKSVGHAIALNREEDKVIQYKEDVKVKATISTEDYKTWLPKQDKCDLLITDPPYSTDVKDINQFAKEWLPIALDRVKDTGSAYVCIGGYPEEIQAYLNVKLPTQMLIWNYNNANVRQPDDKYNLNYQVILYYRFENTPNINKPSTVMNQFACQTINAPDGRVGNRYHTWQKPDELADRLILNSSKEGDLILDPFSCTGTFILSANKLGRVGKGCDISEDNVKIAIERGCVSE